MANRYLDTQLVDRAIKFAVDAHSGTERRGKGFPYVIHVLEAMEIVSTMTSDPELLAAAALHDTVEDTDVTIGDIRNEFGDRVASIVASESDVPLGGQECDTWRARKQAAIRRLDEASTDAKTVALGDKLSNMRAIARDYREKGDALWDLFHAPGGKSDHEWHYRGLAESLIDLSGTAAYKEFVAHITEVFGEQKPELVDMSGYVLSGGGYTAESYDSLDGKRMIKLYSDFIPSDLPKSEISIVRNVSMLGIRTPKAYRVVTDGKRFGVEYERISPKKSFARAIADNPSELEKYAVEFARQARILHSCQADTTAFRPAVDRFLSALDKLDCFTEEENSRIKSYIASFPECTTCLHGDLHIGNIITNGNENYWIDIADFAYGDPKLDFGMFYFVAECIPAPMAEDMFHFPIGDIRKVSDIVLRKYFGPEVDIKSLRNELSSVAALYMIFFSTRQPMPEWMRCHIYNTILK